MYKYFFSQIDCVSDDELVARVNMADAKFSFQEKGKMYHPAWIAPEVGKNDVFGCDSISRFGV